MIKYRLPRTMNEALSMAALVHELHSEHQWNVVEYSPDKTLATILRWAQPGGLVETRPDEYFMVTAIRDGLVLGASMASVKGMITSHDEMVSFDLFYVGRLWRRGMIGPQLFRRTRRWAETTGAKVLYQSIMSVADPKTDRFFKAMGMTHIGSNFSLPLVARA